MAANDWATELKQAKDREMMRRLKRAYPELAKDLYQYMAMKPLVHVEGPRVDEFYEKGSWCEFCNAPGIHVECLPKIRAARAH